MRFLSQFIKARQRRCLKVMVSLVCVSVHRGRSLVTITHDALALTVQDPLALAFPPSRHGDPWPWSPLPCMGTPGPTSSRYGTWYPPASDIWWPSLEICSSLFTSGSPSTLVLISGGHWSRCGWQAGVKHPTGMLVALVFVNFWR